MNDEINNTEQQTNNELLNTINKDEFELRERRLKLIYKILYLFAAVFLIIFLKATKILDENFSEAKNAIPLYSFFLSFLSISLMYIIYYIFSELKCMKINESIKAEDKQQADKDFENIGIVLSISLLFSIILFSSETCKTIFKVNFILMLLVELSIIIIAIAYFLFKFKKGKNEKAKKKYSLSIIVIISTILAYLIFTLAFTATPTV